jgi:hypothetical protein
MTQHKATPEQWQTIEGFANQDLTVYSCLLELRDRLATLETQCETEKACILEIYEKVDWLNTRHMSNWSRIVKLEEGNHQAILDSSPASDGGLVERVAIAVCRCDDSSSWSEEVINWTPEARAAILAVAEWLDSVGNEISARWLRQEVERG